MIVTAPWIIRRAALLGLLLVAGCVAAPRETLPVPNPPPAPAASRPADTTMGGLPAISGWQSAEPGLHYRVGTVGGGLAQLAALRVDPWQLRVVVWDARTEKRTALTVREFAERHHAIAAINGGFFDEKHRPLGLLMHRGRRTSPLRQVDWGVFLIAGGVPEIRHTREGLPAGVTEALQCGPRLLVAGRAPSFKPGESLRAAVGITREGEVVLACLTDGELSLQDFAQALSAWGCVDALNLDGGPSAQLYAKAGQMNLDLPGGYGVPDGIAVLP
jgi:uncharacterized protein YigE (DUF2233 family)